MKLEQTLRKSWWKGYWTCAVVQTAAYIGLFYACQALPKYWQGNKVIEQNSYDFAVERVLEHDGKPGINYEDVLGSTTKFFQSTEVRDTVRKQMDLELAVSRYRSVELQRVDADKNGVITAEEAQSYPAPIKQ